MRLSALRPITAMLAREILMAIALLFGVSVVVFIVLSFAQGDPLSSVVASSGKPATDGGAAVTVRLYLAWIGQLLHGDLGYSARSGLPVVTELIQTGVYTIYLTMGAMALSLALAIPIAVYTTKRGSANPAGWWAVFLAYLLSALPSFWFGYIVIYIAIHGFGFFPLKSAGSSGDWNWLYFLLPVLVLGLCGCGLSEMVRFLKEELARVLGQDYIRTARAKGVSVWRHAFKEGFLLPVTEIVAARIPFILGGAIVVEQIFNWPGMGRLAWQAALDRDFPLIVGITLMAAVFVRLGSLLKQVIHIIANPRASKMDA